MMCSLAVQALALITAILLPMYLFKKIILLLCLVSLNQLTIGCVMKREVTTYKAGQARVEKKYVVKRPVKNFFQNAEFE